MEKRGKKLVINFESGRIKLGTVTVNDEETEKILEETAGKKTAKKIENPNTKNNTKMFNHRRLMQFFLIRNRNIGFLFEKQNVTSQVFSLFHLENFEFS